MKQEKDDTLLETPSLLEEFANLDLTLNRRPQDSTENNLAYRTTDAPARVETNNFMRSTRTFTSLLPKPPPQQLTRHTNPPQPDGAMSLPPDLHQTRGTRSEEQLSVISDLSDRFAGEKVTTRRATKTNSVKSDSPQEILVKEQISSFLNTLAGNEEFNSVDFPKILQALTFQAEDEAENEVVEW